MKPCDLAATFSHTRLRTTEFISTTAESLYGESQLSSKLPLRTARLARTMLCGSQFPGLGAVKVGPEDRKPRDSSQAIFRSKVIVNWTEFLAL
jgi:hypothetical protein